MDLSFKLLGSSLIQNRIAQDITDLIEESERRGLKPLHLVVGNLFMQVGAVHATIEDLHIGNWDLALETDLHNLKKKINTRLLKLLFICEEKSGFIGIEGTVSIYYDPDEPYISLLAIDPKEKAADNEKQTGDGHPILVFKYKPEEILIEFNFLEDQ